MASQAPNPLAVNQAQRNAVLANAVPMKQQISAQNIIPGQQNVINIQPRNVGLIKGFLIEVEATVVNGANDAVTRTQFGSANLVKNFTFTDLNNNTRVNVPGWYLALLDSARQGWGYAGVYANNIPMGFGNSWNVLAGPANLAAGAEAKVKHTYYLPLAYSGEDLRGAIYAAVVSASMNLSITLNTNPFVAANGDPLDAIYQGNANGKYKDATPITLNVYQLYWDQIPMVQGAPILPMLDLNTIYELKQTTLTGIAQGQDFPVPYANFRDFLSTIAVFDNGGQFNAGSDVNHWAMTSANFTNLFKVSPEIAALEARQTFMSDPPLGTYYFSHRERPINTISFGNMELNLNAKVVNDKAKLLVGFEAFAQVNQLTSSAGSSLAAG